MRGQDDASIVAGWFGKKHCCSCNQFSFGSNYAIGLLLQACTWGQKVKEGHKNTQMRSTGDALYAVTACLFLCLLFFHPYVRMAYILGGTCTA